MRHAVRILLIVWILFPAMGVVLPCEAAAAPLAVFPEDAYDAGSVKEGSRVVHDFVVLNCGEEPLEILKVVPG
ncbi:MAG TPA: DUF1573 domain-containing protein [Desulfobacteraceae bacterium]|nr:DUF1573 domain-containing protein [Desulfobacteraceae bacterium]